MTCQNNNPAISASGCVSYCTVTHSTRAPLTLNVVDVLSQSCENRLVEYGPTGVTVTPTGGANFIWLKVGAPVNVTINGAAAPIKVYTQMLATMDITSVKIVNDIAGDVAESIYVELTLAKGSPI